MIDRLVGREGELYGPGVFARGTAFDLHRAVKRLCFEAVENVAYFGH